MPNTTTIDAYLSTLAPAPRAALEKVRKAIVAAAPGAEECISYRLPAFRLDGRALVAFGATRAHCAFYPMSGEIIAKFKKELAAFDTSKGTIRFSPQRPLPATLVKKLVKARIAENTAAAARAAGRRKAQPPTSLKSAKPPKNVATLAPPNVGAILAALRRLADKETLAGMARYAIPADRALGVPVGKIRDLAKTIRGRGRDAGLRELNHATALALWETGIYEARLLAPLIDDPALVSPAQMDAWAADFDSWAVCDHACFHLFDRLPDRSLAFRKIAAWSKRKEEFVKRAAFALIASIALHDKQAPDEPFADCLPLIERAADDERNFVKKGASWALRGIGRRNAALRAAAIGVAKRLAESTHATARWIGKDALHDLTRPSRK